MITLAQLQSICKTSAGRAQVGKYLNALNRYMPAFGITSKASIAAFLAQIAHESQDFTRLTENLNYRADRIREMGLASKPGTRWRSLVPRANELAGNPEKMANAVYGGRLGNGPEATGDGWLHRGAGLKQLTGKDNHRAFGLSIGMAVEDVPAYLQTPEGAVQSACWFWKTNNLTPMADRYEFTKITTIINGGTNGLAERKAYYVTAQRTFA